MTNLDLVGGLGPSVRCRVPSPDLILSSHWVRLPGNKTKQPFGSLVNRKRRLGLDIVDDRCCNLWLLGPLNALVYKPSS